MFPLLLYPAFKACTHPFYSFVTMHTAILLAALASVAYSAPKPQMINLDAIALDYAPPELVTAPVNVDTDIPEPSTPDAITPLQSVSAQKRDLVAKRDAYAAPQPQLINLDAIALDYAPPELVTAPVNVESDIPEPSAPDTITPLQSVSAQKRDFVAKRDGDCSPYPTGSGPVPSPDTPSAFQSDADFAVCLCRRI